MNPLSRRRFLGGAASTAVLGSCSRTAPELVEPARVSIVRAPGYDAELLSLVRGLIVDHGLEVRNKRVVLKPNLVEFDPSTPINTNPVFVEAVLEAFRSLGAADVRIAEGPGHRRGTLDMADQAGYFHASPGFESIFTDLNLDAVTEVPLKVRHSKIDSLYLPNTVLGCDLLVSLPKLKTHHWVGATLSMKNLFGLVPGGVYGWPKNNLHWNGINESIADLHGTTPSQFAIVDGIVGMEGNGPIQGTPKAAGVIVAGNDPVGDWDGDGRTDLAVVRGSGGLIHWFYEPSGTAGVQVVQFVHGNSATDFPTQGDYDGDGRTDAGIWRASATPGMSAFWTRESDSGAVGAFPLGQNGDYPVANFNTH
jgi:uncharacterized protein (DUF362 family)